MKQATTLNNQEANTVSNLYDPPLSDTQETRKTSSFHWSNIAESQSYTGR